MKIAVFGAKDYDRKWFDKENETGCFGFELKYFRPNLTEDTATMVCGYDAVCAFVNAQITEHVLSVMKNCGIGLLLLRCAGYNNVDLEAAKKFGIKVLRVPGYSPQAVAEHAMALALAANRRIHKAYSKVKDNNFSLSGLCGTNLYGKTAGIIGTGKIGAAMARICFGFGMKVIAYDVFENPELSGILEYKSLDEVLEKSDLISLHCPLTKDTMHIINSKTIAKMKDGVILVNTSRGGLIKTEDLIDGIRDNKFNAVGLDVYEEEGNFVFNNLSEEILKTSVVARILSFPNVILTSHQAFMTKEALSEIAKTTLKNAKAYFEGGELENLVES